jgi:hypothetical protein
MVRRDIDAAIERIATPQENTIARWQILAVGGTDQHIASRVRPGGLTLELPGVYSLPGPRSFRRRLWIAHLAVGPESLIGFEAGGAMHDFDGYPPNRVVLITPHSGWQHVGDFTVHQISDVADAHRTTISGLPVTTRVRTIVDLAAVASVSRLAAVVDHELTRGTVRFGDIGDCLRSVARRGKPGVRKLTAILDVRGPEYVPPGSKAEQVLLDALDALGEPEPRRQFPFPGRQFTAGCVDVAYVPEKFIVEVDSRNWHQRIAQRKRDIARDAEAAVHGWLTHRPLAENVFADPEGEAKIARAIRLQRVAQLHPDQGISTP